MRLKRSETDDIPEHDRGKRKCFMCSLFTVRSMRARINKDGAQEGTSHVWLS